MGAQERLKRGREMMIRSVKEGGRAMIIYMKDAINENNKSI